MKKLQEWEKLAKVVEIARDIAEISKITNISVADMMSNNGMLFSLAEKSSKLIDEALIIEKTLSPEQINVLSYISDEGGNTYIGRSSATIRSVEKLGLITIKQSEDARDYATFTELGNTLIGYGNNSY